MSAADQADMKSWCNIASVLKPVYGESTVSV